MNIFRNQQFWLGVKVLVFLLMTWFIVDQIFLKKDFETQYGFFLQHINSGNFHLLVFAVFLMPVNWLLETIKWKWLIQAKSSFGNLLKSVIAGITFGFVTPARSGEFIGRVIYLDAEDKAKVFYLSSIGGIAQTTVTLMAGVFFVMQWSNDSFLWGLTLGIAVSFLFFYFRFDVFNRLLTLISFLERNRLVIQNDQLPSVEVSIKVLLISFARFGVYLSQYVLLLLFFGASENVFALLVHSGVLLVVQTVSPLMPFLDISFRGGTALYVFQSCSENTLAVLSAVTGVWFLNLVLPAMLGYLFILRKKM